MNNDILIITEIVNDVLNPATTELITKGLELSKSLNSKVYLGIIGDKVETYVDKLSFYNLNKVYYVDDEDLSCFNPQLYANSAKKIIDYVKADIVLFSDNSITKDYAALTAVKLDTPIVGMCSEIDVINGEIIAIRKSFGGHLTTKFSMPNLKMISVIPGSFPKANTVENKSEIEKIEITLPKPLESLMEIKEMGNERMSLIDSKVIVSGGRGLKDKSGFEMLGQLANLLGGVVGASRGAVDLDWIDYSHQVGQTSAIVHPDLYIACGISGAIQHQAGMRDSGYIIAINKDINAHIFEICNFGIVGDVNQIVPEIIKEIENKKTLEK